MSFNDPFTAQSTGQDAANRIKEAQLIPTATKLEQLDLDDELLTLYTKATALLRSSEYDDTIPLNQKAQAQNSLVAILSTIVKNREAVRNMTEIAAIEAALGDTLKEFPAIKEAFLASYEGRLLQNLKVSK